MTSWFALRLFVPGVVLPVRRGLRDGHVPQRQPRHLHVQHAVRLQVRQLRRVALTLTASRH